MKNLVKVLTVLVIGIVLVACGGSKDSASSDKKTKIGIIQIIEHESLDAAREGFIAKLKAEGYEEGKNIEINYQNAQGDQANLKTIATKLAKESDVILAIATPSAQAMMAETTEVPIVFTAVTDPVDAGLVKDEKKPEGNITGTTDRVDVSKQIDLIKVVKSDAKTLGIIYNAAEANSKMQVNQAKEAAKKLGLKTTEVNAATSNDIKQAMESLVKKSDVIYVPTDNVIASGAAVVGEVAKANKIPVITASKEQAVNGGLASYGADYTKLGERTAELALMIFKDKKAVKDIPVEDSKGSLFVNEEMAKALGIDPASIKLK